MWGGVVPPHGGGTFSSSVRWPMSDFEMITPLVTLGAASGVSSFGVGCLAMLGASCTVPSGLTVALGGRSVRWS